MAHVFRCLFILWKSSVKEHVPDENIIVLKDVGFTLYSAKGIYIKVNCFFHEKIGKLISH